MAPILTMVQILIFSLINQSTSRHIYPLIHTAPGGGSWCVSVRSLFFPSQAGRVEAHRRVGLVLDQRGVRCSRWKKFKAFKSGVVMRVYKTSVCRVEQAAGK